VGTTPLIKLEENLYAKAEFCNPTGSIKDRMVKHLLEDAFESGELKKGMTVVEATSGNTGISIACMAKQFGVNAEIFMPKAASLERRNIIKMFGAKVNLTGSKDESIASASKLGEKDGFYFLNQFGNKANPRAHYHGTGWEITEQLKKPIDCFVAAIGTGGTIAGVGKKLKEAFPEIKIIGMIAKEEKNLIEGIYPVTPANDFWEIADEIVKVSNNDAIESAKFLIQEKGIPVGISSGANYYAAKKYGKGTTVTVLPDSMDRYYSTKLFECTRTERQ